LQRELFYFTNYNKPNAFVMLTRSTPTLFA